MNILFIHQNFPGQFKHLAKHLAKNKQNRVVALRQYQNTNIDNVEIIQYAHVPDTVSQSSLTQDITKKILRAEQLAIKANELKESGFNPDTIVVHVGWGESLFLKDIWPKAKIIAYVEYYYHYHGQDSNFDTEFYNYTQYDAYRIRLNNLASLQAFVDADTFITPTKWQQQQFPKQFRKRINVIHDGIDTNICKPNPNAKLTLPKSGINISAKDKVVTYISRSLEPIRGFHQFLRAVPQILEQHDDVQILIIGKQEVSYGTNSNTHHSYKSQLLNEIGHQLDPKRVHFIEQVPYEVYVHILQISSAHVYLTYPFVLSWSLLEAMSTCCPVVASNTGPVTEVVKHNHNGLLVNFFEPNQIAESVDKLLTDEALANKLGLAARKTIETNYSLPAMLNRQMKLIKNN